RPISGAVHGIVALASGSLDTAPTDLVRTVAVFCILGAAQLGALRTHMPAPLTWVALNGLAGVVIVYVESPIRILLFAPAAAAAGLAGGEAGGGAPPGPPAPALHAP